MKPQETISQFASVLDRAIATIEEENRALSERRAYRIADMQARKSMVLYELERLSARPVPADAALERLERLKRRLVENRRLLLLNVTALREVLDTLQQVHLGEDSDGTYSAQSIGHGGAR